MTSAGNINSLMLNAYYVSQDRERNASKIKELDRITAARARARARASNSNGIIEQIKVFASHHSFNLSFFQIRFTDDTQDRLTLNCFYLQEIDDNIYSGVGRDEDVADVDDNLLIEVDIWVFFCAVWIDYFLER